jgi:hypothetical protein
MWSPHDHATSHGITVTYDDIAERGRYYPGRQLIVLQPGMHSVVERCTLAHELGHHYTGASEYRADRWAADHLLRAEAVVQCAIDYPHHPEKWAAALAVIPRMLKIWLSIPTNYAHAEQLWRDTA